MAKDPKKTPGEDPGQAAAPAGQVADPGQGDPGQNLNAEQKQEVAALALAIAESEMPAAADPGQPVAPAADPVPAGSYAEDAATCVGMFVEFSIEYCAEVAPLWPEEKRQKVSNAVAKVFEKYNFTFARFGPEIALVMVAGPVMWQTSKVIAQKMNAEQAQAVQIRAPVPGPDGTVPAH